MTLILDPTNTDDQASFAGIRDLASVESTDAQINANPLFQDAEDYIVGRIATAALPSGRTHASRRQIVRALQFLTVANFLLGGGDVATTSGDSDSTSTGTVESESTTIGSVSKTTRYSSSTRTVGRSHESLSALSLEERADWYRERAVEIIDGILSTTTTDRGLVLLTKSTVDKNAY